MNNRFEETELDSAPLNNPNNKPDLNNASSVERAGGSSSQAQTNMSISQHTAGADPQGMSANSGDSDVLKGQPKSEAPIAAGGPTTGGDIDANQGQAKVVGEEAVGGTTPTPGQTVVDEIGDAVGISYSADQPIGAKESLNNRDQARWELNPSSAEDHPDPKAGA